MSKRLILRRPRFNIELYELMWNYRMDRMLETEDTVATKKLKAEFFDTMGDGWETDYVLGLQLDAAVRELVQ